MVWHWVACSINPQKREKAYPVSPLVLGLFIFVVIGSGKPSAPSHC